MSYYCCKRITLDKKNNKIKVCVASSNVFPKTYGTYELCESDSDKYKDYTWEDKLLCLYEDMQSGNIQITTINDNTEKFEYAMCKVREWLRENNIDSFEDLYEKRGKVARSKKMKIANITESTNTDKWEKEREDYKKISEWEEKQDKEYIKNLSNKIRLESLWEVYGEAFKIWKKALEEEIKGEYEILFGNYYKISKLGKYDRGYSRFFYTSKDYKGEIMSYKKAYIVKYDMGKDRDLEIVKI